MEREAVTEALEEWQVRDEADILKQTEWMGRALKYREKPESRTYIFGQDKPHTDGKAWSEATVGSWARHVLAARPEERSSYSVILEDEPLFCFLDVEFDVAENLNHSMARMLATLFAHLLKVWGELYPDCPIAMEDFLILTSSSPKKESRHIHGPLSYAFRNVYHVKAFVSTVIQSIRRGIADNDPDCLQCLITKKRMLAKETNPETELDGERAEKKEAPSNQHHSATGSIGKKRWHKKPTKQQRETHKATDNRDGSDDSVLAPSTTDSESTTATTDGKKTNSFSLESNDNSVAQSGGASGGEEAAGFYLKESIFVDLNVYNHLASLRMFGCTKKSEIRPLLLDETYSLPRQIATIRGASLEEKLFKISAINWVPQTTAILTFPDKTFLASVTPKFAFKRNKAEHKPISFFIFKFPECKKSKLDEPLGEYTHIETRDKKSFRNIQSKEELDRLYLLTGEEKGLYSTLEVIGDSTIFMFELHLPSLDAFLPRLTEDLFAFIDSERRQCLVLSLTQDHYRFVFPYYLDGMLQSETLQSAIANIDPTIKFENVYSRGFVSLLGSVDFSSPEKPVSCAFDNVVKFCDSNVFSTLSKLELLHLLCVRR